MPVRRSRRRRPAGRRGLGRLRPARWRARGRGRRRAGRRDGANPHLSRKGRGQRPCGRPRSRGSQSFRWSFSRPRSSKRSRQASRGIGSRAGESPLRRKSVTAKPRPASAHGDSEGGPALPEPCSRSAASTFLTKSRLAVLVPASAGTACDREGNKHRECNSSAHEPSIPTNHRRTSIDLGGRVPPQSPH